VICSRCLNKTDRAFACHRCQEILCPEHARTKTVGSRTSYYCGTCDIIEPEEMHCPRCTHGVISMWLCQTCGDWTCGPCSVRVDGQVHCPVCRAKIHLQPNA
jgi:hypothetical protein